MVSKTHTDSSELPQDPSLAESHPAYRTWNSYLPLPTCGAMASASGHGVFLKNLSVNLVQLKTKREILNRKEQRRGNPHVLQVRTEAHKEGEVTETKDQSLPRLQLSSTELCTSTFNTVNTPLYQSVNRHALQDHFLPLYHDT